jgi:hypothetical protein
MERVLPEREAPPKRGPNSRSERDPDTVAPIAAPFVFTPVIMFGVTPVPSVIPMDHDAMWIVISATNVPTSIAVAHNLCSGAGIHQ